MSNKYVLPWNPPAAEDSLALMDVLFTAASALKTQTLVSTYLASPENAALRMRLNEIADELNVLICRQS